MHYKRRVHSRRKCSFTHNEDNSQGKKHKKDTTPDKARTAMVKYIEKFGSISWKTELLREATDGSENAHTSTNRTSLLAHAFSSCIHSNIC